MLMMLLEYDFYQYIIEIKLHTIPTVADNNLCKLRCGCLPNFMSLLSLFRRVDNPQNAYTDVD